MERSRPPRKLDPDGLWEYALRILAQRANSSAELRQKLSRRADSPESVTNVLDKLREYGFSDDSKFSEAFAAARLQNQGFGRMRVMRELRAKRVAGSVAQKAIEKTFAGTEERDLARQYLERRYRGKNLPEFLSDEKQLAAAYRRLRTAGFGGSTSMDVLRSYSRRARELQDPPEEE
ncbi:MAG TPA: RecX family transcriptional regulator [Bryobacteraceae bacterium]|jgi:regulatory protein|nr:RecX family transcriptional regulator [Bryobacteraceae bacterium]